MKRLLRSLCLSMLCSLLLTSGAIASSPKPQWVSSFFEGGYYDPINYEGVAFLEIKGKTPSFNETNVVADMAKGALASSLRSQVHKVVNTRLEEYNGVIINEGKINSTAESHLQMRTEKPVFWHDQENGVLWAKVCIPRDEADKAIEEVPDLLIQQERRQIYGVVHFLFDGGCVLRLEEGYSLRLETDDAFIDVGERIFVDYLGNKPQAVYTTSGTKIEGKLSRK